MNKLQELELIDKVQRELQDLEQSQTAVLKKISQIAAHNITLGVKMLDQKLPYLQDSIDESLVTTTEIAEAFGVYREKFFADNKMSTQLDPTVK
jgi:hypothetical protein